MPKRNLRVLKWLGTTPAVAVCTMCNREFKVRLSELKGQPALRETSSYSSPNTNARRMTRQIQIVDFFPDDFSSLLPAKRFSRASDRGLISLTSSNSPFGSCSAAALSQSAIHVCPICSFSCRATLSSLRMGSIWPRSVAARALLHKSRMRLLGFDDMQDQMPMSSKSLCCKSCISPAVHQRTREVRQRASDLRQRRTLNPYSAMQNRFAGIKPN